ncbi:MAG: MmcQ/YjbR family DNA-binding protein [Ignavibacteria bacterium]|jgi:predicted DNA-binding protein (MmcQ/YjbR family)|nr:MmcQ/YjbR family DNA-binding protein [Ignavibacteria bacterium]
MDIETLREYALGKTNVTEETPFGDDVLVYKVNGKIFMLMNFESPFEVSLKCDPELAVEYREHYESVNPGYHMNKTHWNTVTANGDVNQKLMKEMIDHSYGLVVESLPKSIRNKTKKG